MHNSSHTVDVTLFLSFNFMICVRSLSDVFLGLPQLLILQLANQIHLVTGSQSFDAH